MAYTRNKIVVLDFETGSVNPYRTQPIQLASVIVDIEKLEVIKDSKFNAEIKPIIDEEELKKLDLDAVEDKALAINKKNMESLLKAKSVDVVWSEFCSYLDSYRIGKTPSKRPIVSGFNNINFDNVILKRLGMKYGGWNKEKNEWEILHPRLTLDVFYYCFIWLENELDSLSLDSLRDYFGISKENAHDALTDVCDTAEILIRFIKLSRTLKNKISFKGSFANRLVKNENI